jgi:tetratricopeptide (TPR) repeat protein
VAVPGEATVLVTAQHPEAIAAEVEVLRLGPLDGNAFEQLVQLGLPPGMAEMTGGQPFALTQWLRGRFEGSRDATVQARMDVLPPPAKALLEVATLAGSDIPTEMQAMIAGVEDLGPALAELIARGWVKSGGERLGPEVSSPTLRRRLQEAITRERKRAIWVALAKRLQELGGDPIVVAHHARQTGGSPPQMLERAGDAARDAFDDDAAARWYLAALEVGRQALAAGKGDEGRQIRIALKLGLVQRYRGDVLQSEQVLKEALELSSRRGDRWAEVQARRGLARLASSWDQLDSAGEQLTAAVGTALGGGDPNLLCELYLDLADVLARRGEPDAAERELLEGMMLVTGGDGPDAESGPEVLWRVLLELGNLARQAKKLDVAHSYGLSALRHADRVGSTLARARVHAFLGLVHHALGKAQNATEHRRQAVGEMRQVGDRRSTAELLLMLADPQAVPKPDARAWLKEADQLSAQVGWNEGVERSRAALAALG